MTDQTVILRYDPGQDTWYVREGIFKTCLGTHFTRISELVSAIDEACRLMDKQPPELHVRMSFECELCWGPVEVESPWPRRGDRPLCKACLSRLSELGR